MVQIGTYPTDNNAKERRVRLVLCGAAEISGQADELSFEILRCKDASLVADLCQGVRPTVLVVDLDLFADAARVQKLIGTPNIIQALALGDAMDDATCERLLRAGFAGILQRNASPATLIRAVGAVISGELWFPRETLSRIIKRFLAGKDPNQLTPREIEILGLIGTGLSNQEIADKLFITRETVRWHVRGLYSKLGIENRRNAKEYLSTLHARTGMPVQSEIRKKGSHHSRAAI